MVGLKEAAAPRPQPASSPSTADDGGGGLLSLLAAGDAAAGANTLPPPPPLNFSTTRKFSASPLDDVDFDFDFVAAESVRTEPSWPVTEISNWAFPAQQDQIQPWERREKQANLQDLRSLFDEDDPMIYFGGPQTQRMDLESGLSSTVPTFVAPRMEQMQPAFYVPPGYYESRRRMMRHFTTTTTEPPPLMREEDFYQPTLEAPIDLDLDFDDELPSFESNRLSQVLPEYPEYERFRRTFQREGVKGLWNQLDRFQKSRTEIGKQETVEKKVRPGSGVHLGGWERNPDLVFRDDFRGPNELPANLGSLFSLEQQHELLHPNSLPPRSQKLELPSYDEHLDTFRAPISVPKPTSTTTTMRSVFGVRNPFLRSKSREREPPSARPTPRLRFSNPTTARPTATTATPPTPPPSYTGQRYYSEEGTTEDSYGAPSAPLYYSSTDRYIQTPRTRQSTYWDEIRSCCNDTLHISFDHLITYKLNYNFNTHWRKKHENLRGNKFLNQFTTSLYNAQVAAVFNASSIAPAQHQLRDGDTASSLLPSSSSLSVSSSVAAASNDFPLPATDNAGDTEAQVDSPSLLQTQDYDARHARADGGPDAAPKGRAGHQPRHQRQSAAADHCEYHRHHNHHNDDHHYYNHHDNNYYHNNHHHYNNDHHYNYNHYDNHYYHHHHHHHHHNPMLRRI